MNSNHLKSPGEVLVSISDVQIICSFFAATAAAVIVVQLMLHLVAFRDIFHAKAFQINQ